jgi:short-subunit dehydrogenase involved in D-alanine esterification of teichoic acids
VIICGRNLKNLENTKSKLGEIVTIQCEIAKKDEIHRLIKVIQDKHEELSLVINNAGVQIYYDFTDADVPSTLENIDLELNVNLNSLIKLNLMFLPLLKQSNSSAIVNISSGLAICPKKSAPVYCASKAAVHNFSQALRYQIEDKHPNVAVFEAILPLVNTDMTKGRVGLWGRS